MNEISSKHVYSLWWFNHWIFHSLYYVIMMMFSLVPLVLGHFKSWMWKATNIESNVQFPSCEPCMNNMLKLVQNIKDLAIHTARVSGVVKSTYVLCKEDIRGCIKWLCTRHFDSKIWTVTLPRKTMKYRESKVVSVKTGKMRLTTSKQNHHIFQKHEKVTQNENKRIASSEIVVQLPAKQIPH